MTRTVQSTRKDNKQQIKQDFAQVVDCGTMSQKGFVGFVFFFSSPQ